MALHDLDMTGRRLTSRTALIGGATDQMISSVIAFYATGSANWSMAAALGLILLVLTLVLYALYNRLSREPGQAG